MRMIIVLLVALVAGTLLGLKLVDDNGYALISLFGYSFEMSGVVLLLFVFLTFLLTWGLVRLLILFVNAPEVISGYFRERRAASARRAINRGIIELSEGRFASGEKYFSSYARDSQLPLLNFLGAARAAQLQGAHERRDRYLRAAYEQNPSAGIAVLLTQAELQMAHGQDEHALATLRRVQELKPGHAWGMQLLARLYRQLGDWDNLELLIPRLRKIRNMDAAELEDIEVVVIVERSRMLANTGNSDDLKHLWQQVPRRLRGRVDVVLAYAHALIDANAGSMAETVLRHALKSNWHADLLALYGQVKSASPDKQLARIESWLKQHPEDPDLLLAAGRQCQHASLWGKAREYMEKSVALRPTPQACHELGELLQSLGQPEAAMLYFKQGLELARNCKPDA